MVSSGLVKKDYSDHGERFYASLGKGRNGAFPSPNPSEWVCQENH